jgi:hypothetical protein
MRPVRRVRPVALVLGVAGAFLGALALSVLFAHPAGASTVPGPGGAPLGGAVGVVSNTAHPAAAGLPAVVAPQGATPAADPLVTLMQAPAPALSSLMPVIEPIAPALPSALASALGPVVTTLASMPTPLLGTASGVAPSTATSLVGSVSRAATTLPLGAATRPAGNPPAVSLRPSPSSPAPLPAPAWPGFPLVTSSSAAGDASSSSGGTALAAAPVSGPLLPDPPFTGVIPEQSEIPQFLFDLRSSPPG